MPPRERVLGQVNGLMGDALASSMSTSISRPGESREIDLVDGIVTAFGDRLERNEWMTPRPARGAKLGTLRVKSVTRSRQVGNL